MKEIFKKDINIPSEKNPNDLNAERLANLSELELLYNTAPIGLCLIDTNLRYIRVNEMLAAIGGKSIEEHIGRSLYEVIPDIAPRIEPICRRVIETGEPILNLEVRGITPTKTGEEKYWLASYYPLKSNEGSVLGVSAILQDITDIKLARLTLSNNTQRLQALLKNTSAVPWEANAKTWQFTYVGPKCTELLGYPADKWLEKNFWADHIHPEDRESAVNYCMESSRSLKDYEFEYRMIASDGRFIWIHDIVNVEWVNGEPEFLRGFMIDISERKRVEEVQNERLQFETLLFEISTRFVNLAPDDLDEAINESLKNLVEFLGFDRSGIGLFSEDMTKLCVTHSYARPGFDPFPKVDLAVIFPWYTDRLRKGETVAFSNLPHDLPNEAITEKEYSVKEGFKSHLAIPLKVGNSILGGIGFGSFSTNISWPQEFVQRLRIIGEIFANALARDRAELDLKKAFSEITHLKDQLQKENIYLRREIKLEHSYEEIVGQSHAIKTVLSQAEQVARTDSTVLIMGETGTGKELLARAIHNQSRRKGRVMVKVNCAALPSTLIESELFGREKGAYTGALTKQIGRFEVANGSTIFLDEISELSLELQAKLLRVLQEGQFERLGSPETIKVDVRVIAATNRDLEKAVKEGKFREDLYYRLNVFPIQIPPLRERREDIPALVWTFVKEYGQKMGKTIERIPKTSMEALQSYTWPGNIRELRNVVERAMILTNNPVLRVELPRVRSLRAPQRMTLEEVERKYIIQVLEMTGWRVRGRNGAAEILGFKPTTLESRMMKLGIEKKN